MMMRKLLLLSVFLLAASVAGAQSLDAFKERLSEPAVSEETGRSSAVTVTEHGDAAAAVARAAGQNGRIRFKGYRVCIFFDNSQSARARAVEARDLFESSFPDTKVYMVYENPYFKVSAGDCVTAEEAIILLGQVRSVFPKAFTVREDLTVADIVK